MTFTDVFVTAYLSNMKNKVLVLFGGQSVEHDISIITANQVVKNLPEGFEYVLCYVDKSGVWWTADNLSDIKIFHNFSKLAKNKRQVTFCLGQNVLLEKRGHRFVEKYKILTLLNCCHGAVGEDGAVQGVCKCCGVGESSPALTSSAVCMDKAFFKFILQASKIPTPNFCVVKNGDDLEKTIKKLGWPLIVKPANLGSSIGISVCKNLAQLEKAVDLAFSFDSKVVVEKVVPNLREFNCACLRFKGKVFISSVNEVTNKGEIYSFDDKYTSSSSKLSEPEKQLKNKIVSMTEKVYSLFDCKGIVRVDFLYDEKEKTLFVNEANTIPGSLGFYLFKDVPFKELLSCVIEESVRQKEEEKKFVKNFDSDAIAIFESAAEKMKK